VSAISGVASGTWWTQGRQTFELECDAAAKVNFRAMVKTPNGNSDSLWLTVGSYGYRGWHLGGRDWQFSLPSPSFTLAAGRHAVVLSLRERRLGFKSLELVDGKGLCRFQDTACTSHS